MIPSPRNIVINVPKIKNGANGIWLFNPFLSKAINPKPITAPKKKLKNNANKILGKPNMRPKRIISLQSPNPIHSPLETKKMSPKNKNAARPASRELKIKKV